MTKQSTAGQKYNGDGYFPESDAFFTEIGVQ